MKWSQEPRCSPRVRPVCRELLGSHQGCQLPFHTSRWNMGLLLRCWSRQGPHLAMTRDSRGFSRVAAGFSSYNGEFRLPLVLAQRSRFPFELRVRARYYSRVTAGQNRPHLGLCPGPNVPLLGRQGYQGCIPDSPGESGLVPRGSKGLRCPLESRQGPLGAH